MEVKTQQQGSKFLKIMGIIMIVGAAVGLIVSLIALIGVGLIAAVASGSGGSVGMLVASCILALAGAVLELIAGIKGTKYYADPSKADTCIKFGVLVIAICIVSDVLLLVGYPENFSVVSVLTGFAVPVLYLVAAFQLRNQQ